VDKDFYNQSSAKSLGWDPTWFGEKYFDDKLVRAIKRFQKSYGLKADGLCGPSTFRRLWVERQENIDDHKPEDVRKSLGCLFVLNSMSKGFR
jgi:murein L,D-transpeptidase YcbB/YkuD